MGGPQLRILEQPQERFRFRYESELGGTHGQLAGRSGADRRSFPTVKVSDDTVKVTRAQPRARSGSQGVTGTVWFRGWARLEITSDRLEFTAVNV